jgi:membrane protease YdiL (CAAX protease family)
VVQALALGLAYGGIFCWLRRLWPVAFAHALVDFLADLP